jgi:hypothetical protein
MILPCIFPLSLGLGLAAVDEYETMEVTLLGNPLGSIALLKERDFQDMFGWGDPIVPRGN